MANVNGRILEEGKIVEAIKLPVVNIGIGRVSDLKELDGVIWHNDEWVVISTKMANKGAIFKQDMTAVVRVIGDKVKINDLYNIYAYDSDEIEELLNDPIEIDSLPLDQLKELEPILECASEIRPSVTPADYGRKVIVITDDMVGKHGYIECHCSSHPDYFLTRLYAGDVFFVEDEKTCKGYRISKEEFELTHKLS